MLGVPPYWMVAWFTTFSLSFKPSSKLSGWRQKGAENLRSCFLLPLLLIMLLLCFHQCGRQTVCPLVSTAEDRRFLTGLGGGCVATYLQTLKVVVGSHICRRESCLPLRHRKLMGDPARRPSLRQRVGRSHVHPGVVALAIKNSVMQVVQRVRSCIKYLEVDTKI